MGLLDDFSSFIKTPEGMGLLSAVAGGLAGAQRGAPINSLGRAGLAGVMGYSNALDRQERTAENEQQRRLRQMQMDEIMRKQGAIAALGQSVPEQMRPFVDVVPEAVFKNMFKEPEKQQLVTVEGPDGKPMLRWVRPGEAQGVDIGAAPSKEAALPWYVQKGPGGQLVIDPAYAELEKTKADLQRPRAPPSPYYTPIPTVNGIGRFDNRTGRFELIDGGGIVRPADSPALQGQIAGAKERAETEVKTQAESSKAVKNSNKFLAIANRAMAILDSGEVTQSGIGAAIDAVGRMVGVSTQAAQKSAELEALSGWLVSNVPRMEGPQSNFDVENYKIMAGKVGDRTVPIPERKKALAAVIALHEKYKDLNQPGNAEPAPTTSPGVRKYNPKTGRIE